VLLLLIAFLALDHLARPRRALAPLSPADTTSCK
jgi:hypothetical protein